MGKKKTYKIYCVWEMCKIIHVEAESFEEAVQSPEVVDCSTDNGDYVENSFDVIEEVSRDISNAMEEGA